MFKMKIIGAASLLLLALLLAASCATSLPDKAKPISGTVVLPNDTCTKIDGYLTQLARDKHFSGGLRIVHKSRKAEICNQLCAST